MGTLPTIPSFTANDTSMTKLQQLSDAVKFLAVADATYTNTRPLWHLYKSADQTVNGVAQITFGSVGVDTDGMTGTANLITIQTRGIYATEACIPWQATTTSIQITSWFLLTVGASNPNHTAGTTILYGNSGNATGTGAVILTTTPRGVTPIVCYPGDTIQVKAFTSSSFVMKGTSTANYWPSFTGRWLMNATTP